jgi:sugar O-acyltransferase (sialic acid O-acetyltransferase NeuD family)
MNAVRQVVLFGTGDFARIAQTYLRSDSDFEVAAFTVDSRFRQHDRLDGLPVVDFDSLVESHPPSDYAMFVAIGFREVNRARADVYARCKALGYQLISYVNSQATTWGEPVLGDNCFVFEANVIQPNVRLGDDVILWSGNHIGHDSTIGDHCFIASHVVVSGNVTIGPRCFIGVNATLRDGITVAPDCVIGAGALVMRDTQQGEVYAVRGTEPIDRRSWDLDL